MGVIDLVLIALLLALSLLAILLTAMGLPGTWLILLLSAGLAYLRPESAIFEKPALLTLLGLAAAGEALELLAGALGSRRAGGTLWGALGALGLGLVGGIVGTGVFPVVGSVLGAAIGAFAGALIGERLRGSDLESAAAVGRGAFVGRLLGSLAKLAVAMTMWIVVAFAAFL